MGGGYRIGLDIGGTFTDFVLVDDAAGTIRLHKVLTTVPDPAEGALAGLADLCRSVDADLGDVGALVHGTTLVTNVIIERAGAATALLTTRGFRDILEMEGSSATISTTSSSGSRRRSCRGAGGWSSTSGSPGTERS